MEKPKGPENRKVGHPMPRWAGWIFSISLVWLIFALAVLTSCGGAYVGRDQVFAMSMFKTYVKVCRPSVPDVQTESIDQQPGTDDGLVEKPEMARWKSIRGSTVSDTVEAIPMDPIPVVAYVNCLEIGNNTPPQGFWANFFEFLAAAAPVVGLAFGVPAL